MYLRFIEPLMVNKKRILRLMREHHLVVPAHLKLKAKQTPKKSKPRPTKPHEWRGIDMTNGFISWSCWIGRRTRSSATMRARRARRSNSWQLWTWRSSGNFLTGRGGKSFH